MRREQRGREDDKAGTGLILTILLLASFLLFALMHPAKAQHVENHPAPNASALPQGFHGSGHSEFHDFYTGLYNTNPDVRMSCCNDKDCRPTQARAKGDHYEVMINGVWKEVDPKYIIKKAAPDGGPHVCAGDVSSMDPLGRMYCVILPPEG